MIEAEAKPASAPYRTGGLDCLGRARSNMRSAATSQPKSCVRFKSDEVVPAEASATARLTPIHANAETLLPGRAPSTAIGVSARPSESPVTSHSGEEAVFEEARAANT